MPTRHKKLVVDIARSGHSRCLVCQQRIEKEQLRVSPITNNYMYWRHYKCWSIPQMQKAEKGVITFSWDNIEWRIKGNKQQEAIQKLKQIVNKYQNVIASYKPDKRVSEMSMKELKEELKKRDLSPVGKKSILQTRLIEFLESGFCAKYQRKINEKLIEGIEGI